jgi:hypothetical protein
MKRLLIFLLFCATNILFLSSFAQVTIGSEATPETLSLLQLKENDLAEVNSSKGLLLPRVHLSDIDKLQIGTGTEITDIIQKSRHAGLMVYNLNTDMDKDLCEGVYVWSGAKWNKLGEKCPKEELVLDCTNMNPSVIRGAKGQQLIETITLPYQLFGQAIEVGVAVVGSGNGIDIYLTGGGTIDGNGLLTFAAVGTPVSPGTFSIPINIIGEICSLTLIVTN